MRVSCLGSLNNELMEPTKRIPKLNFPLYSFKHEETEG